MGYRIQDLTAATVLTPATDLLEFQQLSQSAPTSRKVTLAQLLASTLQPANNLSDIVSATSARTNLGLGSAATQASSAFDTAGAAAAAQAAAIAASTVYPQVGRFAVGAGLTILAKGAGSAGADITANSGHITVVRSSAHQWLFGIYGHFTGTASNNTAQVHFHIIWTTGAQALLDAFVADALANMTSITGLGGILQDDASAGYGRPFFGHLNPNTSGFGTGSSGIDLYTDIGNAYWPTAAIPNFAVSGLLATA